MDIFKPGLDPFCTPEGRAQNRIPSDLSQAAIQQGTVFSEVQMNGVVFEIVNAIKALGLTPARGTENQLAQGLTSIFYGQQVGQVRRWACDSAYLPAEDVILLGGEIDPADYVDELAILKERCPSWVQPNGKVKLPNYDRYYGVMDMLRAVNDVQEDAMQNIKSNVTLGAGGGTTDGVFVKGGALGCFRYGTAGINNPQACQGHTGTFDLSRVARTASETRPRNINEIHSVTVGKPKERKNPTKFYIFIPTRNPMYTGQSVTLYQGKSGAYMGFNAAIMTTTPPQELGQEIKASKKRGHDGQ